MRRGDIIVNPWVSVDYCGELNPMYATIYLGNNYSLDYKGRKHTWADKVYKENAEMRCPWKVIGHIDLDDIIETAIRKAVTEADRKTEPTISKMEQVDKDINVRSKDEPQTDRWSHECIGCGNNDTCEFAFTDAVKICRYINEPQTEQVKEVCDRPYLESCDLCWKQFHCRAKDEPQTDCAWR